MLPLIADGGVAALACSDGDGKRLDHVACTATGDSTVDGSAHYVLDDDIADVLLVLAADTEGIGLYQVDTATEQVQRWHTPSMDVTRRLATVRMNGAPATRIGEGDYLPALARVRDIACIGLAAEQVGAAARALELTVEYCKQRVQFGRPIGSFQALKHLARLTREHLGPL